MIQNRHRIHYKLDKDANIQLREEYKKEVSEFFQEQKSVGMKFHTFDDFQCLKEFIQTRFDNYMKKGTHMSFHEIINKPCRFYLDIEHEKDDTTIGHNWSNTTANIINFISLYLPHYYNLNSDTNGCDTKVDIYHMVIDSSDQTKYSQHIHFFVYINGEEYLFESNKIFIQFLESSYYTFLDDLMQLDPSNSDKLEMSVDGVKKEFFDEGHGMYNILRSPTVDDNPSKYGLIDGSVYKTNSTLRMLCSFKIDSNRMTIIKQTNYPFEELLNVYVKNLPEGEFYFSSLPIEKRKLLVGLLSDEKIWTLSLINIFPSSDTPVNIIAKATSRERMTANEIKEKRLKLSLSDGKRFSLIKKVDKRFVANMSGDLHVLKIEDISNGSVSVKIYETIREFLNNNTTNMIIANKLLKFFPRGGLRHVILYTRSFGLLFNVYNHFCLNIDKEHKNNHSMAVVDMIDFTMTQQCMDDDCIKNSSSLMGFPIDIFTGKEKKYLRQLFNQLVEIYNKQDHGAVEHFRKSLNEIELFN